MGMRSGASAVQHLLSAAALGVLKHAVTEARRRGHPQVQPLHVVSMLLAHAGSRLRQACMLSHPQNAQSAECRALEVCFNVALDHLPQSAAAPQAAQPILSNALMAALKRAHAHQRRGCPEHQHSPLLAVKVEIDQLIISILDDPSVSRVMKEAGFSSTNVKFNLEDASSPASHPPQDPQHAMEIASQGGSFFDGSCVVQQEESETKSAVKISTQATPPVSSWQQSEVSVEGERMLMLRGVSHMVSLPSREEDIRNVVEILLAGRSRNAVLIGDTAVGANSVVEDLAFRIKNGNVPAQLQGLQFLDPKLSLSSFSYCSSLEMEQKLAELSKIVEECMPAGAILHIGDLQWLTEPMQLKKGPSNFCPAQRTAAELRNLLHRHANNRLWFMGVVTPHIFTRLQALYPSLASEWNLQPVQVTTAFQPAQPTFLQRFSSNLQTLNDQQALNSLPVRASSPIVTAVVQQESRHLGSNGVSQTFQSCPDCLSKFEEECRQMHENESLSLQLAPNKWLPSDDEVTSGGVNGAMCQTKNPSVVQQQALLQQKWQKLCRMQQHGGPALVLQAPLSRLSASSHSKPCACGMGLEMSSSQWSSPQTRPLGSAVVDQPLRVPMYMHSGRDQTGSSPQRTQEPVATAKPAETPAFTSPKDGSSVASAQGDHEDPNGSTGTSAQDASLASVQTNLALGRANGAAAGCSLMSTKLRAPALKPLVQQQPSPLQSLRPSPLQSLGGANPLKANSSAKPAWLTQSPLQNRRPATITATTMPWQVNPSPLARRQVGVTKSPSPPPMKEVDVDDSLKGLYKGLMQRVPWQAAAVAGMAATIMKCRSGGMGFRGQTAKTDTWLLLLGPDPVAKHAVAKALAELVFGGERSLIHLGFAPGSHAKLEADDSGVRFRARTPLDRLAEAVRLKPSAVILLEDIDKADSVMRSRLVRAMEIGKLADSNNREVSFSNTIVVMTSSVGSELCKPLPKTLTLTFAESKLAALLNQAEIRGKIKDSRSNNTIFELNRNVAVVDSEAPIQQQEPSPYHSPSETRLPHWVPKRKPESLLSVELRTAKRTKPNEGRFLDLDLNLATGDAGEGWTGESFCDDGEEAKQQKLLLAKARAALSEKLCALPDYAVGFEPFDFTALATEVLTKLGTALQIHGPREVGLEIDVQLLEYILACIWRVPGGHQVFNAWLDDVFAASLAESSLCGGAAVVELVCGSGSGSGDDDVALPRRIVFDSTSPPL